MKIVSLATASKPPSNEQSEELSKPVEALVLTYYFQELQPQPVHTSTLLLYCLIELPIYQSEVQVFTCESDFMSGR